jgi:hypothetical protein
MFSGVLAGLKPAVVNVSLEPDPKGLPGGRVLQDLLNGLGFWALLAGVGAVLIGCIVWAAGTHASNHHVAAQGRRGALVGGAVAFLIGASPALVNFFAEAGDKVR